MNPKVTTGATVIGAVGIEPPLADVIGHLASLAHIAMTAQQANSYAVVLLAILGAVMHRTCKSFFEPAPPAPAP